MASRKQRRETSIVVNGKTTTVDADHVCKKDRLFIGKGYSVLLNDHDKGDPFTAAYVSVLQNVESQTPGNSVWYVKSVWRMRRVKGKEYGLIEFMRNENQKRHTVRGVKECTAHIKFRAVPGKGTGIDDTRKYLYISVPLFIKEETTGAYYNTIALYIHNAMDASSLSVFASLDFTKQNTRIEWNVQSYSVPP